MKKPKVTMTSREAAALLVSNGATDDAETANLMAEGKLLDPDALERAYYRRIFGFDMTIRQDDKAHKYVLTDKDTGKKTTVTMTDDAVKDAGKLSKACLRLKKWHDELKVPELIDPVE